MNDQHLPPELKFLTPQLQELGFAGVGYSLTTQPLSFKYYEDWIAQDFHGEMTYLKKHLSVKSDLKMINANINSIFSFNYPYRVLKKENSALFSSLKLALYAQDEDYHLWLKAKLDKIVEQLQKRFPNDFFLGVTDTYPLLERDFAYQNHLGWIGKNSCLLHPQKGSLFLIGNILTSLKIPVIPHAPIHDFCGKCTRCLDACPTSAIRNNKTLDSQKCISYWTIESKQLPPLEIRPKISDHFFGCDICQTVCPWNGKILNSLSPKKPDTKELVQELKFILSASPEEINKLTKNTPLFRSKSFGLKRNALIVIANLKLHELYDEVEKLLADEKLKPLTQWTLDCLNLPNS